MAVPYTFGSATTSIPLSQLDSNFATPITLGNTAVQLGNTITSLTGITNISSATSLTLGSGASGTTAVTIDASQNVGFGLTPSTWSAGRAIEVGFAGTGLFSTAATQTVLTANTNYNGAYKYSATGTASYYQQYLGQHQLFSAPSGSSGATATFTQVMAVGKDLTLALQGSTQSAGTGIAFPATQSASSDANTLDDYEEGTWTPTCTNGTATTAYYTKIGRMVYIYGDITFTVSSGTTSSITGLPFTGTGNQTAVAISYQNISANGIGGVLVYSVPRIDIYDLKQNAVAFGNGARLIFSGAYQV